MSTPIIEDYLVSIGFKMNMTELNQALEIIEKATRTVKDYAPKIFDGKYLSAGKALVGMLGSIAIATAKVVSSVADADMEIEKLSNKMYMTEEATRGMDAAAKALGYDIRDLSDIALSEELTEQFKELYSITQQLQPSEELNEGLRLVRSITFEFKKFGTIAKYGIMQVVYYLNKLLGGRLDKIKQFLNDFNTKLISKIPAIARKISTVLFYIMHVLESLFSVVKSIFTWFMGLPSSVKAVASIIGLYLAGMLSPVLLVIAAVGALLLLVDDYVTYTKGGVSALGQYWEAIHPAIQSIADSLGKVFEVLGIIVEAVGNVFGAITGDSGLTSALEVVLNLFLLILNAASGLLQIVAAVAQLLTGDFKGAWSSFKGGLGSIVSPSWTNLGEDNDVFNGSGGYISNARHSRAAQTEGQISAENSRHKRMVGQNNTNISPTYNIYGQTTEGAIKSANDSLYTKYLKTIPTYK